MPAAGSRRAIIDLTAGANLAGSRSVTDVERVEPERQALLHGRRQVPRLREREHLAIVDEHLRLQLLIESAVTHVLDHTDDLLRRQVHPSVQVDHLPDRTLVVEVPLHERAVHDDDRRRRAVVSRLEPSTGKQANAHRLQILVADGANLRLRKIFHLRRPFGPAGRRCRPHRRDQAADRHRCSPRCAPRARGAARSGHCR